MYDADKIGGNAIFEDFDLDGDKDLLTFQQNNFPLMMYENISGEYTSKPAKMIHDQAYVLGVLDINNDTYPDLVTVTFSDANLYFLINDQDNTLIESNQTAYVDLATMIEFEIVDYNLDG